MQYKTMILELLQQRTELHDQLRKDAEAPADTGTLRQGAEDSHEAWKETSVAGEAGQRPEPDRERGTGDSPQGTGGSFALRSPPDDSEPLSLDAGDGVPPPSHAAR